MEKNTFTKWIKSEVVSAKCALLSVYERRDRLVNVDGPRIERAYMEIFGECEQTVIKEEIECEVLTEKKQMIQAVINRKGTLDMDAINKMTEERRDELLTDAAGGSENNIYGDLSADGVNKLKELYDDIVRNFHPQVRTDMTEVQKQLYQKALAAYRRNDLDALELIHDMIFSTETGGISLDDLEISLSPSESDSEIEIDILKDFSLAAEIFDGFVPSLEEASAKEELDKYNALIESTMLEIENLKKQFPYSAEKMLNNPQMIEEYRKELDVRLHNAKEKRTKLEEEINKMTESVTCVNG